MYSHATPTDRRAALVGLTAEEAALVLTGFSQSFITLWQAGTTPSAYQVRHELKTALADNPRHEIYRSMAMLLADGGGPHPDDVAHLEWCRRVVLTTIGAAS